MAVERAPGGTSLIDVLDRVLDKGIVIDAWVRISLVGIDLITIEARRCDQVRFNVQESEPSGHDADDLTRSRVHCQT